MPSQFENFDVGRLVAKALNVKDQANMPSKLNTDELQCVLDISSYLKTTAPSAPSFVALSQSTGNFPAGSTISVGINLVGAGDNFSSSVFTPNTLSPQGFDMSMGIAKEWRILSMQANVAYVAAGAAADAALGARLLALLILRPLEGGSPLVFQLQEQFAIVENISPYSWTWTWPSGSLITAAAQSQLVGSKSSWDGYIPPGYTASFQLTRQGGVGFFPNLTSLDFNAMMASRPFRGDWKA